MLFPWWIKYPNSNNEILNLDWLEYTVKHLSEEVKNFINLNTIKYADPILWDITRQYEANTVVVDGRTGNAYISTRAVPSGVQLNRTEYWTQIYNYADVVDTLREQIAHNEGESTTATIAYSVNDLVFVGGELYRVIAPMIAGDSFVVNSNVEKTTIENELERLHANIGNEAAARNNADILLQTNIDNEAIARVNADTQLQTNIDNEATARANADTDLGQRITDEATARANADTALDVRITANTNRLNNIGYINVKDYGVVGDGVTDDTTAIQTVLDDHPDSTIYFPTGIYKISNELTGNDVNIVGDGQQTSILLFTSATNGLNLTQRDEGSYSDTISIHDISICNDNLNGQTALTINGALLGDRWQVSPIIYNTYIGQYNADSFSGGWNIGLYLLNCNGASVHDCTIKGLIATSEPDYKSEYGVVIESISEPHGTDFMFNNVIISMFINGIKSTVFEGLSLVNSRILGANIGVHILSTLPYPLIMINSTHINASQYCVKANTIKEVLIENCDFYIQNALSNDSWGVDVLNVTHSIINGCSFNNLSNKNMFGIQLEGVSTYCILSSNVFNNQDSGTITFAIHLGTSTSNNLVNGNIIKSHLIYDGGTDNTKVNNV